MAKENSICVWVKLKDRKPKDFGEYAATLEPNKVCQLTNK